MRNLILDVLKWALRILTMVTVIAPLCLAFTIYHDNLSALIMPKFDIAEIKMPDVKYISYNVTSSKTLLVTFNFTNPYDATLTVKCFSGKAFCYEHKAFLGNFSLAEGSVILPPRKFISLTFLLNYTDDGKKHLKSYHDGEEYIYVDLEFNVDIQGIILQGNYTNFGPIPSVDG